MLYISRTKQAISSRVPEYGATMRTWNRLILAHSLEYSATIPPHLFSFSRHADKLAIQERRWILYPRAGGCPCRHQNLADEVIVRGFPEERRVVHGEMIVSELYLRQLTRRSRIQVDAVIKVAERIAFEVHRARALVIVGYAALPAKVVTRYIAQGLPLLRPRAHGEV